MEMTPKSRVIAAIEHREGDRVPVGEFWADYEITERALGRPTYQRSKWKEYVALWNGKRDEIVRSYGQDLVGLARTFGWDLVAVPRVPRRRVSYTWPEMLDTHTWRDERGRVWRYAPQSGGDAMMVEAPSMTLDDITVTEQFVVDESELAALTHVVKELGGTHFIVAVCPDGSFPWSKTVGMEEFLIRMIRDPEFVRTATRVYTARCVAYIEAMLDTGADAVVVGADYCGNRGLLMGPQHFREFIYPALQAECDAAHSKGKYFIKHTDGNTWAILDQFVEMDIDGWHGIQPQVGMGLRQLKEKYGGKLCFFGGVDCVTLVAGSEAEVVEQVRYAIHHAAPGGGLVVTSSNSLQIGTRYENYLALLQAVRDFGRYPITAS